tara:strand:+ start:168 stop:587 length:420 start_codon:yes stop_codon:yes gene_type:complete
MGTRSRIGIELKDNSIMSVYCHWDGYPSFNGRVLREHYTTVEQVRDLIDGGNISSLHTNAGWNNETLPKTGPLYYTMRGESIEENEPRLDKDMEEFFSDGEEYSYIFRNGNWFAYDMHQWEDMVAPEPVEIPEGSINDK